MLELQYPLRLTKDQRRKLDQVAEAEGRKAAGWLRWQIETAYQTLQEPRQQTKTAA